MFHGIVSISKNTGQPLHHSLKGVSEYPYTVSFAMRKRFIYDSYLELPEEKRPPDNMWDRPNEVRDWFDKVFDRKKTHPNQGIVIPLSEVEG